MLQSFQVGDGSAKLTVSELQADILRLEIERDDGLRERDLALHAKTGEIEEESQKTVTMARESGERESALAGEIERLGQEIIQSTSLLRDAEENIKLEIDARAKVEMTVNELKDRHELEQQVLVYV
jgi:hypothetical protein